MSAIPMRPLENADAEFERRNTNDRLTRFLLRHLFEVENRVRVLEGKPALPEAQFRAQVKQAFGA